MREATKKDLPRLGTNQAQCCICYRMFSSDSLCEKTKPYARPPWDVNTRGRVAARDECIEPELVGLIARERADGVAIWGLVDSEESDRRSANLAKARTARTVKAKANTKTKK